MGERRPLLSRKRSRAGQFHEAPILHALLAAKIA